MRGERDESEGGSRGEEREGKGERQRIKENTFLS